MALPEYLDSDQLERLKKHKYKSQGISVLEPILQVFWKWLVTKVPLWVAPNLITFVGLVINILTTVPIVIYDPNAEGVAPSWSYIGCAIGFFIYQSLDAIDGKQARRTGTNNPLGELFDHGCDAISGIAVLLSALSAVGTHDYPVLMLGFSLLLMVLNYCYHWQTYVCGVLHFKWFDVTEAQFSHMVMLLCAATFGQEIFTLKFPYVDVDVKLVVVLGSYVLSLLNGVIALHIIFTSGVGKNGSTVADTSVLSPLPLSLLQVLPVALYCVYSPVPINEYCMLFIFAMVFPMAKSVILIVVCSMTKSPVPFLDYILLGPYIAFANVYFGGIVSEKSLLYAIAVFNITNITLMCISMCQQICECLGIQCFTIPHSQPKKSSQVASVQ